MHAVTLAAEGMSAMSVSTGAVQRERWEAVYRLLHSLNGLDPLKQLFWTELNYERVNQTLSRRDWPQAAREALASRAAAERGIPPDVARRHLCHQVCYAFGEKQRHGLRIFYETASEQGLAPEGGHLHFPAQFVS
jgi:hypothetical protein